MAASIKIRVARIHWLICASVCALVAVWYLYVAVIESFFQGRIAHTSHFPRSPLLANFDSVPNTDDSKQERDCDLYSCFDVSKCIHSSDNHVTVHLYGGDVSQTVFAGDDDVPPSREHSDMIDAVLTSSYSIEGPYKACLFIPPLDLLNQQKLTPSLAQEYLQLLPHWNEGKNHLIVRMTSWNPDIAWKNVFQRAIIAAANFTLSTYRFGFDVAIPVFNNSSQYHVSKAVSFDRPWRLIVLATAHPDISFAVVSDVETLVLRHCYKKDNTMSWCGGDHKVYMYPDVLRTSQFCLVLNHASTELLDVMMMGCIPVFLQGDTLLPFSEVLDWARASITIPTGSLYQVLDLLEGVSAKKEEELRQQVYFLHAKYFSSMSAIILTILDIINERILPLSAKGYEAWNNAQLNPSLQDGILAHHPITTLRVDGFTAVVLTYNRVATLFDVIRIISRVPSLHKIIVVWNNEVSSPPPLDLWPKIAQPLQIILPKANKLSNRFYPWAEIETDAVFSIDDDINMLSADEIQFGFEVWSQYPTQLVGFPPRVHRWDEITHKWVYDSQWLSNISMVLTGAAFYHKYYNFLFTSGLPAAVKHIIVDNMNCEDIAMNFLISGHTGLPPIKVLPREKFVCVDCPKGDSFWTKTAHYMARDECVQKFALEFGWNPLQTVHFRADPVLLRSKDSSTDTLLN